MAMTTKERKKVFTNKFGVGVFQKTSIYKTNLFFSSIEHLIITFTMSKFWGYRVAIINFDGTEKHQEHLVVSPTFLRAYEYAKELLTNEYADEIENYDPNTDIKRLAKDELKLLRFRCNQDCTVKISNKRADRDWDYVTIVKVFKELKKKKKKKIVPQKQLYTMFTILGHFTEGIPICMKMQDTKNFLDEHLRECGYTSYMKYSEDVDRFIEAFDRVTAKNLSLAPGEPTYPFFMSDGKTCYKIGHLNLPGEPCETQVYLRWEYA
jgi:hypothetical protein